jgi:hypothetical protein
MTHTSQPGFKPGQPIEVWARGAWRPATYGGLPAGFTGRPEDPLVMFAYPGGTPRAIQRSYIRAPGAGPATQPPPGSLAALTRPTPSPAAAIEHPATLTDAIAAAERAGILSAHNPHITGQLFPCPPQPGEPALIRIADLGLDPGDRIAPTRQVLDAITSVGYQPAGMADLACYAVSGWDRRTTITAPGSVVTYPGGGDPAARRLAAGVRGGYLDLTPHGRGFWPTQTLLVIRPPAPTTPGQQKDGTS